MENFKKKIRTDDKDLKKQYLFMEKIHEHLSIGNKLNELKNFDMPTQICINGVEHLCHQLRAII